MKIVDRFAAALGYERRNASLGDAFAGGVTSAGIAPNPRLAENLSTVTACINAVGGGLASLTPLVYRITERGREEDPRHPVARLTQAPNAWQTWPDLIEWIMAQVLSRGNALCVIEYDGAGRPTALVPIPWQNVQPMLMPGDRLAYDVTRFTAPWGGVGTPRRYVQGEVFHLKDRSDDGLLGRSRLSRAPEVLGNALALQEFAGSMWQNQATPHGALKIAQPLNETQFNTLRARFSGLFTGSHNARKTLLLDNGMDWQGISHSAEDAEVLESRRFAVEELCRLYGVPPPIIQDYSRNTFTNATQASLWFAQFTLAPWARKIEAEFSRTVFVGTSRQTHRLEIDLSTLMRGDYAARWSAHAIAAQHKILDLDEIRELEGFNPRPAGQQPEDPAQAAQGQAQPPAEGQAAAGEVAIG
jgi:HK97 family phage portal protein